MNTTLVLLLTAVISCAAFTQSAANPEVLLKAGPFDPALAGWGRQGDANYGTDDAMTHGGDRTARIVIAPGIELRYQQVRFDIREGMRAGDEFAVSAWVRAKDLEGGTGAYLALEFVGASGQRVGIAHSRTSPANGVRDWERLNAEGTAPEGTTLVRLSLVLNSHGTAWFANPEILRTGRQEPWPDLGGAVRQIAIDTKHVVQPHFEGVGFHAFQHDFAWSRQDMDEVIYKRWRELNPSFVRINHENSWTREKLDAVAEHLRRMTETGTEVYVTTWDPKETKNEAELAAYAKQVVDTLEYLVRQKGLTNIRYYCFTNELSLGQWGSLINDLPKFRDYQAAIHREMKARGLDIGMLATDASPISYWPSLEWASKNMDDITAIYGGHHYVSEFPLEDERFYPWFLQKTTWAADLAKSKGKRFILGEFGAKQDGRTIDGVKMDVCVYFGTPEEPMVAIQIADAAIAAMNGGVCAMGYWTFMDIPDDYAKGYLNKWGLFKCSGADRSTRSLYYGYGLLTKWFRGPSTVYKVTCADPRLRIAALKHQDGGGWSIAVLSRNKADAPLRLTIDGAPVNARFRKYVYDPKSPPSNPFGDLQPPLATVAMRNGTMADAVGAGTLTVYTSAFHEKAPADVRGLKVSDAVSGKVQLTWQANREPDICYYRVYRSESASFVPSLATQIGSTIATVFLAPSGGHYKVIAVDQSGNAGPVR